MDVGRCLQTKKIKQAEGRGVDSRTEVGTFFRFQVASQHRHVIVIKYDFAARRLMLNTFPGFKHFDQHPCKLSQAVNSEGLGQCHTIPSAWHHVCSGLQHDPALRGV